MKLIPLKTKVAVVRIKNKLETESGIVLTRSTGEVDRAKVIAIGPDVTDVKYNDVLLIDWNKASMTKIDDIPVYIISQDDIVAVYE
jgi:co-chaperonin GroES (HSP10)